MTKRFIPFLLLALSVIVGASCNKSVDNDRYYSEATRGFYPLQVGRYVQYDVDSVTWSDFNGTKSTRHLEMRYTVADTFTDASGRPSYRIDVQQRDVIDTLWTVNEVFYVTPTTTGLEVNAQNLRMLKLIFPVRDNATWFGNKAIDTTDANLSMYSGWVYRYSNYLQPYNNGRVNFNSTVTVTAVNDSLNTPGGSAYAYRNFFREVYAYDVGMIYREATYWTYDPGNPATAYIKGHSAVMRATQYR